MNVIRYKRGSVITAPGIYAGVPMESYHGDLCGGFSVSSTDIRALFLDSPLHYWSGSPWNSERKNEVDTDAFRFGRAAHHLILGEDDFSTLYVVRPEVAPDGRAWNGNNGSCKAWLKEMAKDGKTVLLPSEIENIRGMARSIAAHPMVQAGALNGMVETSIIAKDDETGIFIKSRPDAIPNFSGDFCDLKTCVSVGFHLDNDVSKFRYDIQGALAGMAWEKATGEKMTSFSFLFVEKEAPWDTEFVTLMPEDLEAAKLDIRTSLDTFAWCLEHNTWFGIGGTQQDGRPVYITERAKMFADARRDFLRREISQMSNQYEPTGE